MVKRRNDAEAAEEDQAEVVEAEVDDNQEQL